MSLLLTPLGLGGERAHGFIYHYSSGSRLLVWILFTFR
jgi:hypothetical protein